jgi:hypothetical protein
MNAFADAGAQPSGAGSLRPHHLNLDPRPQAPPAHVRRARAAGELERQVGVMRVEYRLVPDRPRGAPWAYFPASFAFSWATWAIAFGQYDLSLA